MPSFNNLKQLEQYLLKTIQESMEEVGEVVADKTKKNVDEVVYAAGTPSVYDRTFELRDSITNTNPVQSGNETTVEIKHDENMLGHYEPNQHVSVIDGSELSMDALVEIVTEGKAGRIFGTGFWTEKRDYLGETVNELEADKTHVKTLKKGLEKRLGKGTVI